MASPVTLLRLQVTQMACVYSLGLETPETWPEPLWYHIPLEVRCPRATQGATAKGHGRSLSGAGVLEWADASEVRWGVAGGQGDFCWEEVPRAPGQLRGGAARTEQTCECSWPTPRDCEGSEAGIQGPGKRGPDAAGPEREGNAFEFDSKFPGKGINLKTISEGAMFGPSEEPLEVEAECPGSGRAVFSGALSSPERWGGGLRRARQKGRGWTAPISASGSWAELRRRQDQV